MNPNIVVLPFAKEGFALLFLGVGMLPLLRKRKLLSYYGTFVFITFFAFEYFLIYTLSENDFSLDCLLGAYILMFGGILAINNRLLLIYFSVFQFLHIFYRLRIGEPDVITGNAILISVITLLIYSFVIINGFINHRRSLENTKNLLEEKVSERTRDLEIRAKKLYERNKDLEDFAFMVSNDLKRPLRNILNLSEWLIPSGDAMENMKGEKGEIYQDLLIIKEQVVQMDLLINGILNYSLHLEKEKERKRINLSSLIERIILVNSSKNCHIKTKGVFPDVYFNESQLLQVFQNLIQNAIKHNDKDRVSINLNVVNKGDFFVFSVSDNGPGIDKKYHDKIFQLFQRLELKTDINSIGIGLALVKKIIERNGGNVWVESDLGKGTTFFFTIKALIAGE
ncbi:sensor histidine kinase [Tenacibaculum sp. MAR_2009_124]|uniref:sensor histidine kinase n=1 Tax=Tenacibaculum sp. MAR_2009_124 TaxID=1250059 RepID=UPI002101713D|nr:ATP-binding protein [Tenacibaculum sp. MAR_2009_124]